MHILILIAAVWAGFFLLSLALAASNSRTRAAAEPVQIEFTINPLLQSRPEHIQPLRDILAAKLNSPTDRRAQRLAGETKEIIFVVDDDPDILNLIKHVLDLEGFDVRSFTNPVEALKEFKTAPRRPEMVVTDYCMQPMNGLEFISRCREAQPDLKSIVISGMIDENDAQKLPTHSDHFISKPFKVSNLIQTINGTLAEARN